MELAGKRVLVVGAGKSGLAAARLAVRLGARVTVSDKRSADELAAARAALPGVEWETGGHGEATIAQAEVIVLSPGVPPLAAVEAARARGVWVTGEIELASRLVKAPVVGVTGTNGKSTTTALAGHLAAASGRPTFVGGNLGTPLADGLEGPGVGPEGICVVELSSYQLETADTLHCRAAALLNLTPDHLDRYPSFEAYGEAKLRIARNQTGDDVLVVNAEDPFFARRAPSAGHGRVLWFGVRGPAEHGFVDGGDLVLRLPGASEERYPIASLQIVGRHNLANALAALLLVRGPGLVTAAEARAALPSFAPLPHRLELVGTHAGVRYYDDSKATNVDSVVAALDGFPSPYVLIAGGRDKGGSYQPLVDVLAPPSGRCRGVVLIGEAAPLLEAAIGGRVPSVRAATLPDAVREAARRAQSGDAVMLSPACSSFDMFENYGHRGRVFREAVAALGAPAAREAR